MLKGWNLFFKNSKTRIRECITVSQFSILYILICEQGLLLIWNLKYTVCIYIYICNLWSNTCVVLGFGKSRTLPTYIYLYFIYMYIYIYIYMVFIDSLWLYVWYTTLYTADDRTGDTTTSKTSCRRNLYRTDTGAVKRENESDQSKHQTGCTLVNSEETPYHPYSFAVICWRHILW